MTRKTTKRDIENLLSKIRENKVSNKNDSKKYIDINVQDKNGNTFWHYNIETCPYNDHPLHVLCAITGQKIDLNRKNNRGISVLGSLIGYITFDKYFFSQIEQHPELFTSIDYTAQNEKGESILMYLIKDNKKDFNFFRTIEALSNHTEILNLQDTDGNTALHYVCHYEPSVEILQMLLSKGADISIRNNRDKSPVDMLLRKDKEIEKLLSQYMQQPNNAPRHIVSHQSNTKTNSHTNGRI